MVIATISRAISNTIRATIYRVMRAIAQSHNIHDDVHIIHDGIHNIHDDIHNIHEADIRTMTLTTHTILSLTK